MKKCSQTCSTQNRVPLDSELLPRAAIGVSYHPGVGEGKPAAPGRVQIVTDLSPRKAAGRIFAMKTTRWDSHLCLLVLPVVPAVAGLGHQQGYDVVLREAEQRAVVPGCVGEDGLNSSPPVPLQPCGHGAGAGQRPGLRWRRNREYSILTLDL